MQQEPVKINTWLYPFSFFYGTGVYLRNKLFDWGMLRSQSFDIPIISIGNLTVGGTGKTPHTEFMIKLLKDQYKLAMLSRGYKRKTKGYILADTASSVKSIGDEPFQIKKKFPDIQVAVDGDRCRGIRKLMELDNPPLELIILDDAYQHRYVEPGINILLTDYSRLFCDDALLPAGRLRENANRKNRADIVIVTKCPQGLKPIDFNIIAKRLKLFPYQELYFTSYVYKNLTPLFPETGAREKELSSIRKDDAVLLVTGIASPALMEKEISRYTKKIKLLSFDDHHNFTKKDIKQINQEFGRLEGKNKLIITTEKDAARLSEQALLTDEVRQALFALPIEVEILQNQEETFIQNITSYVRTNKRNRALSKK